MRTIQNKRRNRLSKRPSSVRLLKRFAKVEVFGDDEPHLVDVDAAKTVAQYRWTAVGKYAQASVDGRSVYLHRFVFGPIADGLEVDHIDRNSRNSRRNNLRAATHGLNIQNRAARGSSCYKGVSWCKLASKWRAQIQINRNNCHLGVFVNEVDAAKAYDQAAIKHYGVGAFTNFPHRS